MGRLNAGDKLYSNTSENLSIENPANMDLAPVITVSRLYYELLHHQCQVWYALPYSGLSGAVPTAFLSFRIFFLGLTC